MKHAIKHIHFVGIGGVGMSGIAEVLFRQGYSVSGSDLSDSETMRRLSDLGIRIHVGHAASNMAGADVLVSSSAVASDNPELCAAREQGIQVLPRALMLAELMRFKQGIAIAGTHGKTTTTGLVTSLLIESGLDPTFVIGGALNSAGVNARLGQGDHIVVEADESDASFLSLLPVLAVVTNIDADHMETYGHDVGRLKQAFLDFLHRLPSNGAAILCIDDAGVREILPQVERKTLTYGFAREAQVRALAARAVGGQMHFSVRRNSGVPQPDLQVILNLAGRHNVLNALAVIALALELKLPDSAILRSLANFQGVGRRFQRCGEVHARRGGSFTLIDDYGHHPVEMAVTLAAVRGAFPGRRLVLAFQPHRYTRTRDCLEEFVKVMAQADAVLLTEVYGAGEAPIASADGLSLARALSAAGRVDSLFVGEIADLAQAIMDEVRDGDVVLCMGAGSIAAVPAQVVAMGQCLDRLTQEEKLT